MTKFVVTEEVLEQYAELQAEMKRLRKDEMDLRIKICDAIKMEKLGVNNILIDGIKVKATKKVNYNLDEELLEALYDDFTEAEREAIRFKPQVKLREYKNLPHDGSLELDKCITVVPATPSLEVIFPDAD